MLDPKNPPKMPKLDVERGAMQMNASVINTSVKQKCWRVLPDTAHYDNDIRYPWVSKGRTAKETWDSMMKFCKNPKIPTGW